MERDTLSQVYKVIVTAIGEKTNLMFLKVTGISTEPIQIAAKDFLNSLLTAQQHRTSYFIDDKEWRMWSTVDNVIYKRQGVSLKKLNKLQRDKALQVMQA